MMKYLTKILKKENYYLAVVFAISLYFGYWSEQVGVINTIIFIFPQVSGLTPILYLSTIMWLISPVLLIVLHSFDIVFATELSEKKFRSGFIVKLLGLVFLLGSTQISFKSLTLYQRWSILIILCVAIVIMAEFLKRYEKVKFESGIFIKEKDINYGAFLGMCAFFFLGGGLIADYVKQSIHVSIPDKNIPVIYLGALSDKYILRSNDDVLITYEIKIKTKK